MPTMSINDEIRFKKLVKSYSSIIDRNVALVELSLWKLKIGNRGVCAKSELKALDR